MRGFHSPIDFERSLIDTTTSILSSNFADIRHNQRIGDGINSWELDLVFTPHTASANGSIYIFEFKYSSSPTLADSQIFTQLAKFAALNEANRMHRLKFLLVTNGKARPYVQIPNSVTIVDEVWNEQVWQEKFRNWLWHELPDYHMRSPSSANTKYW